MSIGTAFIIFVFVAMFLASIKAFDDGVFFVSAFFVCSLPMLALTYYSRVANFDISRVVYAAVVYVLCSILVSFLWHIVFTISVKRKYKEATSEETLAKKYELASNDYWNTSSLTAIDEKYKSIFDKKSLMQKTLLSNVYRNSDVIFSFGPTLAVTSLRNIQTRLCLDNSYRFSLPCYIPSFNECADAINSVFPPRLSDFKPILVRVALFWPVALGWLLLYKALNKFFNSFIYMFKRLYDGIGRYIWNKM